MSGTWASCFSMGCRSSAPRSDLRVVGSPQGDGMEIHPGVHLSNVATDDWRPDPEVGGEMHVLVEDETAYVGLSRFSDVTEPAPWTLRERETVLVDLDMLAGEAGYSRFHFARAFTAAYGETPRAYLTRRRIERAKTLLRTANLSVTEICFLVGFASLGSFSARFRKLVGRSPTDYRDDAVERTGVPPIPGCVVMMWTRPHPDGQQSRRSALHPGPATVPKSRSRRSTDDQPPQPRECVRARPGPGKGVLH